MSQFLHGSIIRKFEVTKIGRKNQLYLLDKEEIEYVYSELKKVIDLDIFEIVKSNNLVKCVLKDNIIDNNFKDLVKEFNFICNLDGHGFVYEDNNKDIENAMFIDEFIYENMCSFISEKLAIEGYHIQLYVSFFLMDHEIINGRNKGIVPKLLTGLARKAILNKLSSALIFAIN